MPYGPLSLPARIYLLAWNAARGRATALPGPHFALRAAALAELAQRELLSDVGGVVTPVVGGRTGDPALDALMELVEGSRPRGLHAWMGHHSRAQLAAVRDQLARDGYLRVKHARLLGLLPATSYALERSRYVDALRAESRAVLCGPVPVAEVPEDEAALAVCAATGKIRAVATGQDRVRYRERLDALTDRSGDRSPELRALMRKLRRALAAAVAAAEEGRISAEAD
ncbi:GPP34 family phosphoprotein [Streptomyces sp. NPDC059063]|uniref:GOLPH3/VPS74 family protein n=1 Tax=unclassified Streptomyces TaxID=2593676 RepID=UPI003687A29D